MKKLPVVSGGIALILAIILTLQAQETAIPVHPVFIHAPISSSEDDLATMIQAVELTTPQPAESAVMGSTFWSAQNPGFPPFPANFNNTPVWNLGDGVFLLDDVGVDYSPATSFVSRGGGMHAMDEGPPSPGDGDGGDGTNTFYGSPAPAVDYGTNLWIAQVAVVSNNFVGIGTNTLADVQYEIQSRTNLLETNWESEGFILGSELTNWTPLSVAQGSRTNLFLRLRSWADDGSGLPIWWQLQYFGYIGVDPYADPDGDGWNNLQEFQNGTDPTVFNTPPAPQGLTASYGSNGMATVTWQPSPGPVTNYLVYRYDFQSQQEEYFNVSPNTDSLEDDLSADVPYDLADYGPTLFNTYAIQAQYAGGNSAWNGTWLANSTVPFWAYIMAGGSQNSPYLVVPVFPHDTVAVQLTRIDRPASGGGDTSYNATFLIPVGSFTNGIYPLPATWAPPIDAYGDGNDSYEWWVQAVNTDGGTNYPTSVIGYGPIVTGDTWPTPFSDGRVQLKQNLVFLLRAASANRPFQFSMSNTNYFPEETGYFPGIYYNTWLNDFNNPSNYVYSGIYTPPNGAFNSFGPFEDNYWYENFVYDSANVDATGAIATGAGNDSFTKITLGSPPFSAYNPLQFQLPASGAATNAPLLATNQTRWLYTEWEADLSSDTSIAINYSSSPISVQMAANAKNYWGLPYLSAELAHQGSSGLLTTTLNAGNTVSLPNATSVNAYPEIAQPQFQTVEYDFWLPNAGGGDPIPGSTAFSPTNASRLMIMSSGNDTWIAGYAKLAVTNSYYSGVYAYLGQYFDKAYQITNGIVTTNTTGVLSPYGDFFAKEPGAAALVTMPDPDTGERGTCTVYCASMQIDKNNDGTMDLSFSGADATSQANPMRFWINSGYSGIEGDAEVTGGILPDYSFGNVTSERDLENFARLWICGMPVLPASQGYIVTLNWQSTSGNPAINLYNSAETNGGTGYLTDTNIAAEQSALTFLGTPPYSYQITGMGAAIARITNGTTFTFPSSYFTNSGNKYFLFEGAGIGSGELTLTISDSNSNTIAKTGVWLDLHDIKDFYERAVITNNTSGAISNWSSSIETLQNQTTAISDEDTNIIVFVHGINVGNWDWLDDSDTVFKRLYWAGYHGKFTSVDWPCNLINYLTFLTLDIDDFNESELKAYKASPALATYLTGLHDRFPNDRLNILAHSQGNAVVSEAIEQGAPCDTYILTQGALPASCYDVNAPTNSDLLGQESSFPTPDLQPMGYHGVYTNLPGKVVSFFNSEDKVLGYWLTAQENFKPSLSYSYDGTNSLYAPVFSSTYIVTDSHESRANVSRSRTLSVGAQAAVQGIIGSTIDLNAQFGFNGSTTDEHSAQWTRPIQTSFLYYKQILVQILPTP